MGENRLYFFLGLPSYKYGDPKVQNISKSSAPICILLERSALGHNNVSYPFDSGCIERAKAEFSLDKDFEKNDYCVTGNNSGPELLLGAIYENVENYFSAVPSTNRRNLINGLDFQTQALFELLSSNSSNMIDERITSIEVQSLTSIPLSLDTVMALVVPDIVAHEKDFIDLAHLWKADIVEYPWRRTSHTQRGTQIADQAFSYYKKRGVL